jgi:arylsulfatase A-like enzyme
MSARPVLLLAALLAACSPEPPAAPAADTAPAAEPLPRPVHLLARYRDDLLAGRAEVGTFPRTEWRFDALAEPETLGGFRAVRGVADLRIEDGRLAGTADDGDPLIAAARMTPVAEGDRIHSVEIRARISAGTQLNVRFVESLKEDPDANIADAEDFILASAVPIRPGEEVQRYVVPAPMGYVGGSQTKTLLIRPSDAAGARFAIESVRVIFADEHLATLASGVGWHGLGEIYRDALALRGGESVALPVELPADATLFVAVGTVSEGPVSLRVALTTPSGSRTLLRRTVTTPDRWERTRVGLAEYAGAEGTLVFSVDKAESGGVGFFGNPVLRGPAPEVSPRAVILVLADTLRPDHLQPYGYERPTAPNLAGLASEGALFQDVVAQGSWTKVSTPSILTGLYQSSHGVTHFTSRLPDAAQMLPEVLQDAGYATIGFSSVPFTGRFSNMNQGYDVFHELTSLGDNSTKTSRAYVDRLVDWLEDHADVPVFAFLHVFDPHDPFEPRAPYDTLWADPARREQHLREVEETRPLISWPFMKQRGLPNPAELAEAGFDPETHVQHNQDWYDGSIRGMDAELGRLVERLRELGLADDAVVAFTSDHGEEFFEHGSVFHGETLYGEMLDVPLVLWAPGRVRAGTTVEQTVQSIDLMPTLLDLAGVPVPEVVQGRSLVPLLRGGDWTARPAVAESHSGPAGGPPTPRKGWSSDAIVSGGWKLIHNTERPEDAPEFELYHRERDPLDQVDVAASFPAEVERLRQELEAWRGRVAATRLDSDGAAAEPSPDELERLRDLGYVE